MPFFRFDPIFQERVWGGRALAERLGRALPPDKPIGESWEIVDRPEAQSVVRGGEFAGRTLRELIEARAEDVMGPEWERTRAFPILVKWLDCRERLSLQVHPPASIALSLGGEPKTENWFVAHADPGAGVLAGLVDGVDADKFRAALANNTAEKLLRRHETRAGDSILIRSGVMHAIDGGNLILEIQQNSDTTYRVYDWGRVGLDGKPRQMHVEQSLACLTANTAPAPHLLRASEPGDVLADCAEFGIRRVRLARGARLEFAGREQPRLLSVVTGRLQAGDETVERGENVLLPFAEAFAFTASEDTLALVTENFARV
ncbi:MAG: class I mannose-6-phosphate isomerase [Candidatus Didemnitutus sp.]|nr:class I mannose-6-phosphate isomerase [Candidatus Didemnitutus sp.]